MPKPPSPTEFYETLGLAIASWSRVDDAFCDLFTRLVLCSITGKGIGKPTGEGFFILGNVFYSTTNFRGRLELLDHMMERLVSDGGLLAEWNAIKNKAGRLYARRNVLAHGTVWGNEDTGLDFMSYSIFSIQDQKLEFQQMQQCSASFLAYSERIRQLAIDANTWLASRKSGPENLTNESSVN